MLGVSELSWFSNYENSVKGVGFIMMRICKSNPSSPARDRKLTLKVNDTGETTDIGKNPFSEKKKIVIKITLKNTSRLNQTVLCFILQCNAFQFQYSCLKCKRQNANVFVFSSGFVLNNNFHF